MGVLFCDIHTDMYQEQWFLAILLLLLGIHDTAHVSLLVLLFIPIRPAFWQCVDSVHSYPVLLVSGKAWPCIDSQIATALQIRSPGHLSPTGREMRLTENCTPIPDEHKDMSFVSICLLLTGQYPLGVCHIQQLGHHDNGATTQTV